MRGRRWAQRLHAVWQDLFGEALAGDEVTDGGVKDRAWVEQAQARREQAELRAAWAEALARAYQADRDWQAARLALSEQDQAVDEALCAGQESAARALQGGFNLRLRRLEACARRRTAAVDQMEQLAQAIQRLEQRTAATQDELDNMARGRKERMQ